LTISPMLTWAPGVRSTVGPDRMLGGLRGQDLAVEPRENQRSAGLTLERKPPVRGGAYARRELHGPLTEVALECRRSYRGVPRNLQVAGLDLQAETGPAAKAAGPHARAQRHAGLDHGGGDAGRRPRADEGLEPPSG
jgi:hypothetical protein